MPTYLYTTEDGKVTVPHTCRMSTRPKFRWVTHDGIRQKAYRDIVAEHRGMFCGNAGWPMYSDALGVNPKHAKRAAAWAKAHGVPTEYRASDGAAKLEDPSHRRRFLKLKGCRDLGGFD